MQLIDRSLNGMQLYLHKNKNASGCIYVETCGVCVSRCMVTCSNGALSCNISLLVARSFTQTQGQRGGVTAVKTHTHPVETHSLATSGSTLRAALVSVSPR